MGLIAIIGGTGVCDATMLEHVKEGQQQNYYGTIRYMQGTYKGKDIVFLPRHGKTHSIPPHLINYRANILGLKKLGVTAILSTTAVGSLHEIATHVLLRRRAERRRSRRHDRSLLPGAARDGDAGRRGAGVFRP